MKNAVILITILLCGIVITQRAEAENYTLSTSGWWLTAGNWTPNGAPGVNDNVTIPDTFTVQMDEPEHLGDLGDLYVRNGTMNITGGNVLSRVGYIGNITGSNGTVNISSGSWTGENTDLAVGFQGTGTLNITGGSISSYDRGHLGYYAGSNGTVNISSGSLTNNQYLRVGSGGTGTLNITGGTVSVGNGTGTVTLAVSAGSSGTLNIGTGGAATGTLAASTVTGGGGTGVVNFNHTGSTTFAPTLTGSLRVNKLGSGTTTLTGNNTYTGATVISQGTLFVNGNQFTAIENMTVENALAKLGGRGTLGGNVTVMAGGALMAGDGTNSSGLGTLTLNKDLLMTNSATETILTFVLENSDHSTLARTGSGTWTFDDNQQFSFINLGGATATTYSGIITGLASNPGTTASWGINQTTNPGWVGTFQYSGGNIDVIFTAVPEPSTWALLSVAGGLIVLALRHKHKKSAKA